MSSVQEYITPPYLTDKTSTTDMSTETDVRVKMLERHGHSAVQGMPKELAAHTSFKPQQYVENVSPWCAAQLKLFCELLRVDPDHDFAVLFKSMQRNPFVKCLSGKKQPANLALLSSIGMCQQKGRQMYERNPSMEGMAAHALHELTQALKVVEDELLWQTCVTFECSGCCHKWTGGNIMFVSGKCPQCKNDTVTKTDRTSETQVKKEDLQEQIRRLESAFKASTYEHSKCLEHAVWSRSQPLYERDDDGIPLLDVQLRDEFKDAPRDYQLECVMRTRGENGYALLPCGAGKTLTQVLKIKDAGRSTMVVVPSADAAEQFRTEILRWTTIHPNHVVLLTSNRQPPRWFLDMIERAQSYPMIFVTTYGMTVTNESDSVMDRASKRARITASGHSSYGQANSLYRDVIKTVPFGLVLLDEVHMAATQRRDEGLTRFIRGYNLPLDDPRRPQFVGFTATRERLDGGMRNMVEDLLGGGLLYEVTVPKLQQRGYIATVYIKGVMMDDPSQTRLLPGRHTDDYKSRWLRNLGRLNVVHHLIQTHYRKNPESRIILVVERLSVLKAVKENQLYKNALVVTGETDPTRRTRVYKYFRQTPGALLLVSKVAEVAVDLPQANVLIMPMCGDRAPKTQYFGRVQRRKDNINAAHAYLLCDAKNEREKVFMKYQLQAAQTEGYNVEIKRMKKPEWFVGAF